MFYLFQLKLLGNNKVEKVQLKDETFQIVEEEIFTTWPVQSLRNKWQLVFNWPILCILGPQSTASWKNQPLEFHPPHVLKMSELHWTPSNPNPPCYGSFFVFTLFFTLFLFSFLLIFVSALIFCSLLHVSESIWVCWLWILVLVLEKFPHWFYVL